MTMPPKPKGFREPFSAVSHLVGASLAAVGLVALLVAAHGKLIASVAVIIYSLSLIALYTLSTVYHSLHVSPAMEKHLQRMDHIAIFLLIAGTYTPVCLITLRPGNGLALFAAVWALALIGTSTVMCWRTHPHWVRVTLYILMGWLAALMLPALHAKLGYAGLFWMLTGGIAYTSGIVFYAMDCRRPKWLPALTGHEIWHLFVLTGSVCHYILILWFVAPSA